MSKDAEAVDESDVERWFEEDASASLSESDAENEDSDPAEKYARSQLRVVRETKDYQLASIFRETLRDTVLS